MAAISASLFAAESIEPPTLVEKGFDHRVWKRSASSYVELATGLHFVREGQLVESEEKFEIFNDGLVARNGQHQVILAPTADAAGLVDLLAPDGQRFRSQIVGLAFTDLSTGNSVLIAEPQNSVVELVEPNVAVFRNAMAGPFRCDFRFIYTRSAFEQDVILREQLPSPAEYGLNPQTTRLELWTEFSESPSPARQERQLKPERQGMQLADAAMSDELLSFGRMRIGPGVGFLLDDPAGESTTFVGKNWIQLEGRTFLIEKVDLADIAAGLQRLPQAAVKPGNANAGQARLRKPSRAAALAAIPRRERRQAKVTRPVIQTAATLPKEPGFVMDYQQTLSANTNGFVFKADTTYYISGTVILSGTNIIEGASVIKMAPGTLVNRLTVQGPLICRTDTYRPAIFTSRNDNTIGEIVSGSSGIPTNYYGIYMDFSGNSNPIDLHDIRIRHANYGLRADPSSQLTVRNAQFSSNGTAIAFGQSKFRNVLIHDGMWAVGSSGAHTFENVTFHRLTNLRSASYTTAATNCLIIEVTNNVILAGANNYSNLSGAGVFQTIGSGTHYPANGTTRNSGTTNIDATLLAALRKLTTYPPIVLSNHFTSDTVLTPQAQRDTDEIDQGYHWPPLDFCWNGLRIINAKVTLSNDVAVGIYDNGDTYGIGLDSGAQLCAVGLPHRMAQLVPAKLVQERALGVWASSTQCDMIAALTNGPAQPLVNLRFLQSVLPGGVGNHLSGAPVFYDAPLIFRDCQLVGGKIWAPELGFALTNNLFDRVNFEIEATDDEPVRYFINNLFHGGKLYAATPGSRIIYARNNLFDGTTNFNSGSWTNTHNAYLAGATKLSPTNHTDRFLAAIDFEQGALGWYYYPTNGGSGTLTDLVDAGSTNANLLGFAHHTTAANQTKESTSMVDIGFKYIAVNANSEPADADGDGFHDYLEDVDGDETADTGESDWQAYNSIFDLVGTPAIEVFTPLKH